MAAEGSFFVVSVGTEREFTLQRSRAVPPLASDIVWQKPLASGSLLKVSAMDNRAYYHAVHKAAGKGGRYSVIFRTVDTHARLDPAIGARLWAGHRFSRKRKCVSMAQWLVVKKPKC